MNKAFPWICAALIALTVGALAGNESRPATTTTTAPVTGQRAVPAGVCPPGFTGVWVDVSTMECLKERP